MPRPVIDITGNVYKFLKVVGYSHTDSRRKTYWKCKCLLCGNVVVLRKDNFIYKYSENHSCGCDRPDRKRELAYERKDARTGRFIKQERKAG